MKRILVPFLILGALPFLSVRTSAQTSLQKTNRDTIVSFHVSGVCDQCKHRIETAVKGKGVSAADWNVDTKFLTVSYAPSRTSLDKISNRIAGAGHDTYYKKAKDADYNNLPSCCKYREITSMDQELSTVPVGHE